MKYHKGDRVPINRVSNVDIAKCEKCKRTVLTVILNENMTFCCPFCLHSVLLDSEGKFVEFNYENVALNEARVFGRNFKKKNRE